MTDTAFIAEHLESTDLHRLLLSAKRYPGLDMPYLVGQIEALRRVRDKIPAWYRPDLRFPPGLSIEQASSAATARFKATLVTGNRMADLTGGMGIDSWHFAQAYRHVDYIEQNEALVAVAKHNFEVLGASQITCHHGSAEDFIAAHTDLYDLIYLDPARRGDQQQRVFRLEDCTPNIIELLPALLERSPRVLLKTAPLLDLKSAVRQLGGVAGIWVVAVNNEVKEVLYLLQANANVHESDETDNTPPIYAINIRSKKGMAEMLTTFSFTWAEEEQSVSVYAEPQQFIYESDAAVLKSGAFRSFGARFGLAKLHANTHLYTSAEHFPDVPGRQFEVLSVCKYDKKAVGAAIQGKKANIATRNFPDTPDEMRKKLGLTDGGEIYLFGVTLLSGKLAVLVCAAVERR